jgi:Ca2+-dependent lipid-binding protein
LIELERVQNPWPLEEARAAKLLGAWIIADTWPERNGGAFNVVRLASGHLGFQEIPRRADGKPWTNTSLLGIMSSAESSLVPTNTRQGQLRYVSAADAWIADLGTGETIKLEAKAENTLLFTVSGIEEPLQPWIPPKVPIEYNRPFQGGLVDMIIVKAQDLLKMDVAVVGEGKADPYIKVLGEDDRLLLKTDTKKKTLNPIWGTPCLFNVSHREETLTFAFFDSDFGSGDDPMGRATLHLSELKNLNNDMWLNIEPEPECPKAQGRLNIQVTFRERSVRPPLRGGIVELVVVAADDLLAVDRSLTGARSADPYVKVRTSDTRQVFQTAVVEKSLSPVWDAYCSFNVSANEEKILFDVFDSDVGSGDDSMGVATLWLEDLRQNVTKIISGRQRTGMIGEVTLDVEPTKECPKAQGRLQVHATFYETPLRLPFRGGTVKLKIVRAQDLLAVDVAVLGKGASDPYVQVCVGDQHHRVVHKTKAIQDNLNPVFDEECSFRVSPSEEEVALYVWDQDVGSGDDPLGRATLRLSDFHEGLEEAFLCLETYDKCPKATGQILVHIQFFEKPLRPPFRGGHVDLVIADGSDLLAVDLSMGGKGKSDPYVKLSAGDHDIYRTSTQQKTLDPVWDEQINFRVAPEEEVLTLKMFDSDVGSGDDPMGSALIWLSDLKNGVEQDLLLNVEAGRDCPNAHGKLHVIATFYEVPERSPFRGGTVELVVVEARDLLAMDFALKGKGSSDPYVTVLAAGEREVLKTEVAPNTLNPVFNAAGRFSVFSSEEVLIFSVSDHDATSTDDSMGDARIWLTDMQHGTNDFWLGLEPNKTCPKASGQLRLQVIFHEHPPRGKAVTLADRVRDEPPPPVRKKPPKVRARWLLDAMPGSCGMSGAGSNSFCPPGKPVRSVPPSAPPPLRPVACGFTFRMGHLA